MAVSKLNPSAGGIPYGNTAGRPANPGVGRLYSNGELQRLELYTGASYGWQNIVAETPGVTGYSGTVIETNSTNTITVTGTNFASGAVVSLVGQDGTEYISTTTTVNNLTSITATFGAIPQNNEPYDIKVTNPSNLYGVYYDILTVNDKPLWSTAAGSLGTIVTSQVINIQLQATDEENNSLTYSLVSGALPTGLTLSSSGLISGTNSGTLGTTYNFTISVSDSINTAQSRAFSFIIPYPVVTGGTLTSDATYYYRTFTANGSLAIANNSLDCDYLVVAGGAAGGSGLAGGGGAGGYRASSTTLSSATTYTITIGGGGAGTSTNQSYGANGGNSSIIGGALSISATGGGGGGYYDNGSGRNGGSGGGGGGTGSTTVWNAGGTGNAGSYSPSEGNNGGRGTYWGNSQHYGGGGGGAGGSGFDTPNNTIGGDGGAGINWLSLGTFYAGGGGGSGRKGNNGAGGYGGSSIGGRGAGTNGAATNGAANTGSGGGGGDWQDAGSTNAGGNGAGGIIIFRYTRSQVGG